MIEPYASPTDRAGTRPRYTGSGLAIPLRLYNRAVTTDARMLWDFADRTLCRLCPCGDHRLNRRASVGVVGAISCSPPSVMTPFFVLVNVASRFIGCGLLMTRKSITVQFFP